jgi:hypothetical protein
MIAAFIVGSEIRFDGTISLGNIVSAFTFLLLAALAWRDLIWRIRNLETWKVQHMSDADGRDKVILKMDKFLDYMQKTQGFNEQERI